MCGELTRLALETLQVAFDLPVLQKRSLEPEKPIGVTVVCW